ncbi:MAG: hydroxyphenylacetyl-CoA thioesterase PaaI [Caulobacteraceae bacterium]|jgi:acyl-CoA thioesterase|nr:hydroxyphenylacetyl-CoA thioesterase PaaI [Caulobacteraceae bacterium]
MNEADKLARQIADTLLQREGTGPAWGVSIDDAREGYALVRMTLRDDMLNGHRSAHGGMIFALADTAFAYACNSRNENTVAQHASISFLAPAQVGDVLIAEAREVSRSGRSGVYQVSVKSAAGAVIAEFTGLSRTIGGSVIN